MKFKKSILSFLVCNLFFSGFVAAASESTESTDSGIKTAFGITLGKKAKEVENLKLNEKTSENSYSEAYSVIPPKLHNVFNNYSVLTSKVDGSIMAIRGETKFRVLDECVMKLSPILDSLQKKYGNFEDKEVEFGYPYYMYKNNEAYIAISCSIYSATLKIDYADNFMLNEAENTMKMKGKEVRYKDEVL